MTAITITQAADQAKCSRQAIYKALESKRLTEVNQLVRGVKVDKKWKEFRSERRRIKKNGNRK